MGTESRTRKAAAEDGAPPMASMAVIVLAARLRDELDVELAPLGLTFRRYSTLGHISGSPGMSYSELARRSGVTVQSMFKLVRALEDDGLVSHQDRAPGRGNPVGLTVTDAGRLALTKARRVFRRVDARTFAPLGADEAAAVRGALGQLVTPPGRRAAAG